jgi:kynureninase
MTPTRADCEALDRSDVLAGKRGAFLLPKGVIYLDGNSLGVLGRNVPSRVQAAVEREWGETLIKSWNEHGWCLPLCKAGAARWGAAGAGWLVRPCKALCL